MKLRQRMKEKPTRIKSRTFAFCTIHGHVCDDKKCSGRWVQVSYSWGKK